MGALDQFVNRVREAIMGGIFTIVVTAFARVWASFDAVSETTGTSAEFTSTFLLTLFQSAPGLLTIAAIVLAGIVAGPPGLLGAMLEVIGTDMLLSSDHAGGLGLIVVGAMIVTLSSFLPWLKIYAHLLGESRY